MISKLFSATLQGVDAVEVEVEVNTGDGEPKIIVVGLPDTAVKESKDRVTTAIANSGFRWPRERTTVNLAPADIKKEGPSFDLPIAIGMVAAARKEEVPRFERCLVAGELALTGEVRPVRGALSMALEARSRGKKAVLMPTFNANEAAMVEGVDVYAIQSLRQAYEFLTKQISLTPVTHNPLSELNAASRYDVDFSEVKGQFLVKRAIEVAVAGGHNIIFVGPPGSGKSMLAKRIPTIIPPMSLDEAVETTKIHSICGLLTEKAAFITQRPFRSPHHTISDIGLLGGSANPSPGEVSLAHNGVLFLDELPEFRRSTLEVMRQPLEDGKVTISRAAGTMTFPSDFMLVAAMNPCPCGFQGDPARECRCNRAQVERYRSRISGPLLDRIDIHVEAPPVQYRDLSSRESGEPSEKIRERVMLSRQIQSARLANGRNPPTNSKMSHAQIRRHCQLDASGEELLRHAMEDLHLSARAYDRILKVARTIADLSASESIEPDHIREAIQYRTLDRNLWH